MSPAKMVGQLPSELTRADEEEKTALVFRVSFRPLPGRTPGHIDRVFVPPQIEERLLAEVPNVRLAAVGPDDLVGYVAPVSRRSDGEELAATILSALSRPIDVEGLPHQLSPRVGGALFDRENPTTDNLIQAANLALEATDSTHPVTMFHPYQRVQYERHSSMAHDLRDAVLNNEPTVALQPSYSTATGKVSALKVMARWDRGGRGQVPPAEFIGLASELGVMHILNRQVLQQALFAAADLLNEGLMDRMTLWIAVSSEEILHPEFQQTIADAVRLDPRMRVGLELNPSPPGSARDVHDAIRSMVAQGARASIADFGRGWANLDVMEQLHYDSVRIDRDLSRQMAGNQKVGATVRALVALAKLHELEVTVAGIENADQLAVATDMGVDHAQGFHFTRPLPLDQLRQLLDSDG